MANNFFSLFFLAVGKTKHTQWYLIFNKFSSHRVGLVCGLSLFFYLSEWEKDPNKTLQMIHVEKVVAYNTMFLNDSLFITWGIESIYSFAQVLQHSYTHTHIYVKCVIQSTNQQLRKKQSLICLLFLSLSLARTNFKRKRKVEEKFSDTWTRHVCVYFFNRKITSVALINKTFSFLFFYISHSHQLPTTFSQKR